MHDDLYRDMLAFSCHMDCSNFPKSNPCYSTVNDRRIGYFKDECSGVQPREFVGLRSKMYSLLMPDNHSDKIAAKGIKKNFVKKHVSHDDFLHSLYSHTKTKATYLDIRSKNHKISTITITKDCLNPYDDKRYILDDGVTSLSFEHEDIPDPPHTVL